MSHPRTSADSQSTSILVSTVSDPLASLSSMAVRNERDPARRHLGSAVESWTLPFHSDTAAEMGDRGDVPSSSVDRPTRAARARAVPSSVHSPRQMFASLFSSSTSPGPYQNLAEAYSHVVSADNLHQQASTPASSTDRTTSREMILDSSGHSGMHGLPESLWKQLDEVFALKKTLDVGTGSTVSSHTAVGEPKPRGAPFLDVSVDHQQVAEVDLLTVPVADGRLVSPTTSAAPSWSSMVHAGVDLLPVDLHIPPLPSTDWG